MPTCKGCRHCVAMPGDDMTGICRRFPPQITIQGGSSFPVVKKEEWICGEFAKADKPKAKKAAA